MIEIRQDSESIEETTFQEEIVLENYFPCANRAEVLCQMKQAVLNGVTLMVLTGEEGSGKTMMCRLLEQEVSPSCKTVFFPRPVDSFEDVVRMIVMGLGLEAAIKKDDRNVVQAMEQVTDYLLTESFDLLLIFDEAENMFLATLERIRKMLDRIIDSGAGIHVLFSGRKTLLENCDQLSICDFHNTDEQHFDLAPLTEDETADYLKSSAGRLTGKDTPQVFTDDVVSNIYALAQGNFRTTSILGEESVKIPGDDTSFMVLLEGVNAGDDSGVHNHAAIKYPYFLSWFISYLPWIGGATCCVFLLLFLFSSEDNESDMSLDGGQTEKVEQNQMVPAVRQANVQLPESNAPLKVEPADEVQLSEEEGTAQQVLAEDDTKEIAEVGLPAVISSQQDIDQVVRVAEQIALVTNETIGIAGKVKSGTVEETLEKVVVEAQKVQVPQKVTKEEVEHIALLRSTRDLKKKPASSLGQQPATLKVQPRMAPQKTIASKAPFAVEQLYNARLLAGSGWGKNEKENMYTVQLMALAAETAEKNLKKLLAQANYRQEAGNFYIFKKATTPENIFVFYGEYLSIERARLVRDSLPQFLRDQKPYVLSIKGAIAKVRN